jgi:hypothetical protein
MASGGLIVTSDEIGAGAGVGRGKADPGLIEGALIELVNRGRARTAQAMTLRREPLGPPLPELWTARSAVRRWFSEGGGQQSGLPRRSSPAQCLAVGHSSCLNARAAPVETAVHNPICAPFCC